MISKSFLFQSLTRVNGSLPTTVLQNFFSFEKIIIDVINEQGGLAKFDVLINDEIWHDSERDGIPGPSALDQMYSIIKQILL